MIRPDLPTNADWPDQDKRESSAWLMSIALHTVVLVIIGLVASRPPRGLDDLTAGLRQVEQDGDGTEASRQIAVAFVHRLPANDHVSDAASEPAVALPADRVPSSSAMPTAETVSGGGSGQPAANETDLPSADASFPPGFTPPIDLEGLLSDLLAVAEPSMANASGTPGSAGPGGSGIGGLGMETGDAAPGLRSDRGLKAAGGGAAGATSLFGVTGVGNRVVYVVDRSDSMNGFGGRPWMAAKTELIRSLAQLTQSQFFQLVLYNEEPRPFRGARAAGGVVQMIQGEQREITRAQQYIELADAFGGTSHLDAVKLALRMRPDVIFFLTDGRVPSLSGNELSEIRQLAVSQGTTIHGIEFGTQSQSDPTTFVRVLASENRGEYRYFDVTAFSPTGQWRTDATSKPISP